MTDKLKQLETAFEQTKNKLKLLTEKAQAEKANLRRHMQLLEANKRRETTGVVVMYLDKSSSMLQQRGNGTKFQAAVEILHSLYDKYATDPKMKVDFFTFNQTIKNADFPTLYQKFMAGTWQPHGGTALFDTLDTGIERCREYKAQGYKNVIMLVISDGEEQSSKNFDPTKDPEKLQYQARIQQKITQAGDEDILVKFLLEGQDAMKASQKLGIKPKNFCQTDLTPGPKGTARSTSNAVSDVIAEYCSAAVVPQRTKTMRGFTADHKSKSISSATHPLLGAPRRVAMNTCPPRALESAFLQVSTKGGGGGGGGGGSSPIGRALLQKKHAWGSETISTPSVPPRALTTRMVSMGKED